MNFFNANQKNLNIFATQVYSIKLFTIHALLLLVSNCQATPDFVIDGMIGKQPTKLYWLMKQINDETVTKRCLILHGKPGNGKTTLASKIAQLTNSKFLRLDAPSIVNTYVGQGAHNVANLFEDAQSIASQDNSKVIVFIDEIDAIASNVKTEFRSEHKIALQQLWLEIDKQKNNKNIFIIFATNHLEKLDRTFLDRFGGNVIEIKNPDAPTRKQILEHYFSNVTITLPSSTLNTLVKKTEDLSIRCLEDLAYDVHMTAAMTNHGIITDAIIWDALHQTKSKFANNISDDADEKRWQKISTMVGIVGTSLGIIIHSHYICNLILNTHSNNISIVQ
ncbi:MAG: ATP-binding protein [Candidatus Dependentiae bacterium]|nr:ATP-binding protein [Candidatus Dependentiae bacterium]